jgi:hypothetical protein
MTDPQKQWSKEERNIWPFLPWINGDRGIYNAHGSAINLNDPILRDCIVDAANFCAGAESEIRPEESLKKVLAELFTLRQQAEANKEGWISVDERYPVNDDFVLFYEGNWNSIHMGSWIKDEQQWRTYDEWNLIGKSEVTHWRELPPPPLSQPSPVEAQEKK